MSDKWRRNKQWEDANLTGPWAPVRWVLRAAASVSTAVVLLSLVALYGVTASVPVGLLALAPTYALYGLTALTCVLAVAGLPVWGLARKGRVGAATVGAVVLVPASVVLWWAIVWPHLRYEPATGAGLRLFGSFVDAYRGVALRRLPGMEMSELEYYSWWPLRVILLLFVVNLVVATVRRIDFTFRNIGVLTVHTGIVTIALGGVYYKGLKREGDTLLRAGRPDAAGRLTPGEPVGHFYDNTDVALLVDAGNGFEQRPLRGVPRYYAYNLGLVSGETASNVGRFERPWDREASRPLDLAVMDSPTGDAPADLKFRVVGYAPYADPVRDWERVDPPDEGSTPLRIVMLYSSIKPGERPGPDQAITDDGTPGDPVVAYTLPPGSPAERTSDNGVFSLEYTLGMSQERWRDLSEAIPAGSSYALVVEVPGDSGVPAFRGVFAASAGAECVAGATGYRVRVRDISPEPPFPIITPGYRDARSSVAVVRVIPPSGEGEAFDRYVYHRFPELNQDLSATEVNERGMPKRTGASPAIRIALIEADRLHAYIDEPAPGRTRAIIRERGGRVTVTDEVAPDGFIPLVPKVRLKVESRWDGAVRIDRPGPTPADRQDPRLLGTHDKAMIAVEVTRGAFRRVVWLPFEKYWSHGSAGERVVTLPDGGALTLAFARLQHPLPGFVIRLADFEMIAYDHRGAPRDYRSRIRVSPTDGGFEEYEHVTQLNAPLRAPFMWDDARRGTLANAAGTLLAGLSPNQFKLSQAGWDASGWEQTQRQADAGLIPAPYVRFTILGVGNNPGIHVIALGAVLMALGIPWAFYVKPYLVRREKARIRAQVAAGAYAKPVRTPHAGVLEAEETVA